MHWNDRLKVQVLQIMILNKEKNDTQTINLRFKIY